MARWLSFGVSGGYNWMANYSRPGTRDNYNGGKLTVSVGFLWGKGR